METGKDTLTWIFEKMALIRAFEERTRKEFAEGRIPGFVHLYAGQEAVATGVCAHLTEKDYITSTHRGHGHCIAKGCEPDAMMAELFGKATGLCKGKGGSMHIADLSRGMLGANSIVGGSAPLACGSALSAKLRGTDQVTVCFLGDGAVDEGTVHESLNLAAVWSLPVVFIIENNGYAQSTPVSYHSSIDCIARRADGYGIPGVVVDGMDALAVYEAAGEAIQRCRDGRGPTLFEAMTYRFYGHYEGDPQTYKPPEEAELFRGSKDPLVIFRQKMKHLGLLSDDEMDSLVEQAARDVDEAVRFAEESPYPDGNETLVDVYVSY